MFTKVIYTAHPDWHKAITDVNHFNVAASEFMREFFDTDVFTFELQFTTDAKRFHPADMYQFFRTTNLEELPLSYYSYSDDIQYYHLAIQYFISQYTKQYLKGEVYV